MQESQIHPPLDKLKLFCEGALPDFEEVLLEEHLDSCGECLQAYSRLDALLYSGFTAAGYAEALAAEARVADPLVKALTLASGIYREFAAGLRQWLGGGFAVWTVAAARQWGEPGARPISGRDLDPVIVRLQRGESRALVDVRPGQSIRVESGEPAGALVVLFAQNDEANIRVAALQSAGEVRSCVFDDVAAGRHLLAIAPPG